MIFGSTEPPRGYGPDRGNEHRAVVNALFEQVGAVVRTLLEHSEDLLRLGVLADDNHADPRMAREVPSRAGPPHPSTSAAF
jgi:hypothetical protein